ncbi:unnamed protein product [Mytilus coruscus]|uniref:DNA helicase n=1 Tax=Mytilus coruscus TaxID=42192 RepID=A0A6J8AQ02_MYTCO|nr:unnamed protein product [Mytilus coruscus]
MQFPLRPAAAKTIHRSQRDTLNILVVDLTSHCKIDHTHYVALSRITIQGLQILHLQENKISINFAVKKEKEHLRKNPPATSLTFLNEIPNKYRIVFLNANSLHKHIEDVRSDYSLTSADLICFCETKFLPCDNEYLTKLQNFHTYRQDSIAPQGHIRPSYGLAIYYKECTSVDGYPIDVNSKTIESSLIQLQYPINDLLVCFLYRPPKTPIKSLLTHLNTLK